MQNTYTFTLLYARAQHRQTGGRSDGQPENYIND